MEALECKGIEGRAEATNDGRDSLRSACPAGCCFLRILDCLLAPLTCSYPSVANHLWKETSLNCQEIYLHTNQNIYAIAIMSNYGTHRQSLAHPRQSTNHTSHTTNPYNSSTTHQTSSSRLSTLPTQASKQRQLSHLNSQLAQLTAHMSDLENLLRMTAVQAEGMRGLGGYAGGMFMAASKVLGEEAVKNEGAGEGKR